jgi:UDP-N-acetyl-D-glucosamine dehydrogenase
MKELLVSKLNKKSASIGVIGLGYVGLPLALIYSQKGYKVIGIDTQEAKVNKLNAGQSFIKHISDDEVSKAKKNSFEASSDFSRLSEVDAIIICVPTPLNEYREPDLSFVIESTESSLPHLKKGQVICLVSTTYPGTTEEELLPRIESTGLQVGSDIFLVYSPEREDPGNKNFKTGTIPKVVGGLTDKCLEVGLALFGQVIDELIPVSSLKVAEITKLLENIYRAVNIGLVNDMKKITDKMGIDIFEVINAAASKPFGFKPFYPGPGLGGHCIPIDPFYLSWKSRQYGIYSHFIELAGEINSEMPDWVVDKISEALNDNSKSVKGSKILVLGLGYKKDVDDMRESPSVTIINKLLEKGALVDFSDPYIEHYKDPIYPSEDLKNININNESLAEFDLTVLVTDHSEFDPDLIEASSNIIVDTRGIFSLKSKKVYRA